MSIRKVLFDTNRSKFLHIDDYFLRTVLGLPFEANITSMWAFVTLLFLNCFRCCAALIIIPTYGGCSMYTPWPLKLIRVIFVQVIVQKLWRMALIVQTVIQVFHGIFQEYSTCSRSSHMYCYLRNVAINISYLLYWKNQFFQFNTTLLSHVVSAAFLALAIHCR